MNGFKHFGNFLGGKWLNALLGKAASFPANEPIYVLIPFSQLEKAVRIMVPIDSYTPIKLRQIQESLEIIADILVKAPGNKDVKEACLKGGEALRTLSHHCIHSAVRDGNIHIPETVYNGALKAEPLLTSAWLAYDHEATYEWRAKKVFGKVADTNISGSYNGYTASILKSFIKNFATLIDAVGVARPPANIVPYAKGFYDRYQFKK